PRLMLLTVGLSAWPRGCSGTASTMEQVRTQAIPSCFRLVSLLLVTTVHAIHGQARGQQRLIMTTIMLAAMTIMRSLVQAFFGLSTTTSSRTGGLQTGHGIGRTCPIR